MTDREAVAHTLSDILMSASVVLASTERGVSLVGGASSGGHTGSRCPALPAHSERTHCTGARRRQEVCRAGIRSEAEVVGVGDI